MAYLTQVDGTPSYKMVSFRFMDASGDRRAIALQVPDVATNAQIEALGQALGNATRAILFEVEVAQVYRTTPNASLASTDSRMSVDDNVVIMYQDAARQTQRIYIPAPNNNMLSAGESVNTSNALYQAVRDACDAVLGGTYTPVSVRFTERRNINDRRSPA